MRRSGITAGAAMAALVAGLLAPTGAGATTLTEAMVAAYGDNPTLTAV